MLLRRLALASSIGASVAASLVPSPSLAGRAEPTLETLTARVTTLEALARGPSAVYASASAAIRSTEGPRIIDGRRIAAQVRAEVREHVDELKRTHGVVPGLAVVLVGSRTDSQTYVRMKKRAANEVGFHSVDCLFEESVSTQQLIETVRGLNADPKVHGILVQLPLPRHVDESKVLEAIDVAKDVDGFSATNIGNMCLRGGRPPLAVPCTPAGCVELLQRCEIEVKGKDVVVVGRSNIVGMPVAHLLMSMDATVTVCHSRTADLPAHVRRADIVIAAVGAAEMVKGSWLKPGATVIDVGVNSKPAPEDPRGYVLCGDVDFAEASQVAGAITPVPGGVGPMTIAMLMKNTLNLARHSVNLPRVALRRTATKQDAASPSHSKA
jgi:5,10-methylene-tetrahydrofolate dehydrogenase/methenyl tetrahydrofolate cyclohydrolase